MDIGAVIMLEGDATSAPRWSEIKELAVHAEAAGLDGIWLYDHLLFDHLPLFDAPAGQWECFSMLAALAAVTERLTLGTLVAAQPFRNPALTVKMATAIDEISGGRLVLGLGAGWNQREFEAFGFPFQQRVARFEDALTIMRPLLRDGHVDVQGRWERTRDCIDLPRGPRAAGPPILIGATGPRMLRLAARFADQVNTWFSLEQHTPDDNPVAAACHAEGRDPATLSISVPLWAAFPDLGPTPSHMGEAQYWTADALAVELTRHADWGMAGMMIDFRPNTLAGLERVTAAMELARRG